MRNTARTGLAERPSSAPSPLRPRPARSGFSTTELVVSLGVVAVLGVLVATAATRAVASARARQCLHRQGETIRLWALAVEASPLSGAGRSGHEMPKVQTLDGTPWTELLRADGGVDDAVFRCPSRPEGGEYGFGMNPLAAATWYYANNWFGGGFLLLPMESRPRPVEMVYRPAATVLLCEAGTVTEATASLPSPAWEEVGDAAWRPYVAFAFDDSWSGEINTPLAYGYDWANAIVYPRDFSDPSSLAPIGEELEWNPRVRALGRHAGRASAGFVDGHAAALPVEELTEPEWGRDDCLFDNQVYF